MLGRSKTDMTFECLPKSVQKATLNVLDRTGSRPEACEKYKQFRVERYAFLLEKMSYGHVGYLRRRLEDLRHWQKIGHMSEDDMQSAEIMSIREILGC